MSTSAVFEFIQRSETDRELRARLGKTHGSEAVVGLADDLGYDFSRQELGHATALLTFLRDLWTRDDLRDAVANADDDYEVVRIASRFGYAFTIEDLSYVMVEPIGELRDEELGAVAGGTDTLMEASGGIRILLNTSVERQMPKTDFGSILAKGVETTSTQLSAAFIPGGAVVSAAVSGLGSTSSAS